MGRNLTRRRPPGPLILLLALELAHFALPLRWGDDAVFFGKVKTLALTVFLKASSRPLVDSATHLFARCPVLWRVLNPLMLFALGLLLAKLLGIDRPKQKLCLGLLVLVPSMGLVDAGFIATTVNYLWPVTLGLFAVYSAVQFRAGRLAWLRCALALPALLYAMNMQQLAVVLPPVFLLLAVLALRDKQAGKAVYAGACLLISAAAAGYVYYKSTTGDNNRFLREAGRYFPDFPSLPLPARLELGFSSTFHGLAASLSLPCALFLCFCVFLAVMVIRRRLALWQKALSFLPGVMVIILLCLRKALPLVNYKMAKAAYHFSWWLDLLFLALGCAVVIMVFTLIQRKQDRLRALLILGLGFASRLLMGFSPTVWASGYRTFYILMLALLTTCALLGIIKEGERRGRGDTNANVQY